MKVDNKVHQFLFHPLSEKHSPKTKLWATITVVALSAITLLTFLIAFTVINIQDSPKEKKFTKEHTPPRKELDVKEYILPFPQKKEGSLKRKRPDYFETPLNPSPTKKGPLFVANADLQKVLTVKEKHYWQLQKFEKWAKQGNWEMFHHQNSHYDWWMFPIDRGSNGQGTKYTVHNPEIKVLKNDPEFMKNFRRGAELVAKSWGWDITTGKALANPKSSQKWENWPVRLGKMADSLHLFGEEEYRANMKNFALQKLQYKSFPNWMLKALGIHR